MRHVSLFTRVMLVTGSLVMAAMTVATQGNSNAKSLKNPIKATPKSIADGKNVFQKYCKFCHGEDAKGDGPMAPKGSHPPNLIDDTWTYGSTDGEIYSMIRNGSPKEKSEMKPYKSKLTDEEMWSVVNYVRSLAKP